MKECNILLDKENRSQVLSFPKIKNKYYKKSFQNLKVLNIRKYSFIENPRSQILK